MICIHIGKQPGFLFVAASEYNLLSASFDRGKFDSINEDVHGEKT